MHRWMAVTVALSGIILLAGLCAVGPANAQRQPDVIKLISFAGATNLPSFVAETQGYLAAEGIKVEFTWTPSSTYQIQELAKGSFDIAHTAFDNVVAWRERGVDLTFVMGLTRGGLILYARPEYKSIEQLRGKPIGVDSPTTAFALVLYKILATKGLQRGVDYQVVEVGGTNKRWDAMKQGSIAAAIMSPPFSALASAAGYTNLGSAADYLKDYQGSGAAVMRSWARANEEKLVRHIRAHARAMDFIFDPKNRATLVELLMARNRLSKPVAEKVLDQDLLDQKVGLLPKVRVTAEGLRTVIELRGELGMFKPPLPEPTKYYDPQYYEKAMR